jgi:two-component sensor histidine kinase
MLRARGAPSEAAREALREAAQHALALARVHTHLTPPDNVLWLQDGEAGMVDTALFVLGLCADLDRAQFGEGLRSVALVPEAEAHALDTERAVPLGLVLNEAVTNALKYAFPEDQAGSVHVRFRREGDEFVLTVEDDGVGLPDEGTLSHGMPMPTGAGLGTRLLRALATQVRGRFTRRSGEEGRGTIAELRFPAKPPG